MLKKYPFVKQEGYKDCGCASLSMIIKFYNGNVSIDRLRDLTHTNKNGTSAYNLIKASKDLGFYSKGLKGNIENLHDIILPCIAHVIIDNIYKHYVVIYEINLSKNYLIIADPAKGITRMSFSDFSSIWSGILIILYPVRSIPYNKKVNFFEFIFNNIVQYKKDVIYLFVLSIFVVLFKLLLFFYFKFIIEGLDISKNYL